MNFEAVNRCLDEEKWEDLERFNLAAYFRSSTSRNENEVKLLSKVGEIYRSGVSRNIEILCLKILINSCSYALKHEDLEVQEFDPKLYEEKQIKSHLPYKNAIEHCTKEICKFGEKESLEDGEEVLLKMNLKFVCNFMTMCQTKKNPYFEMVPDCMKDQCFKNVMMKLTGSSSEEIATISCIYCHNALSELVDKSYFSFEDCVKLYKCFVSAYKKINCNAAEEGILHLLQMPDVFENVYECSDLDEKKIFMEVLKKNIDQEMRFNLPDSIISHLICKFNKISDKVTLTNNIKNLQEEDPEELSIVLDILLHICSNNLDILQAIQKKNSVLINCVGLLKMLHLTGKQSGSCFAPMDYTKEMLLASKSKESDAEKDVFEDYGELNSIVYGFKSKLIRMVGNLVNLNQKNQNLVREMDGISVIMDCCVFDAKNPLIKECSIFAIRNLCEGNLDNQKQIEQMVKLESDSTGILEKMGMTLQDNEDGTGIRIAPLKKN